MSQRDFLKEITPRRREQVAQARARDNSPALRSAAEHARETRAPLRLRTALQAGRGVNIIGEFKRASPSLGSIRADARVAPVITTYEEAGVCAFSVLTEPDFFQGSIEDLRQARAATDLPILRKDFIVDEYQIDEAASAGADAILLIVAALSDSELLRLRQRAEDETGLDALTEVHSADEMQRAIACGARLIGVNNRDLRTLTTSIEMSIELAALAPANVTLVSESGISSRAQIERLSGAGFRGFLIGEALMRAPDPAALIRSLRGEVEEARHD